MIPIKRSITDSVRLSIINTDKFKANLINLTFSIPLTEKNAAMNMLLVGILKRGSEKYPDLASINRRLDELYDSSVDFRSARLGKNLQLSVTADFIDEDFVPSEDDLLDEVLELIEQAIFHPRLKNNSFPKKEFEQEKRFLLESIDSTVNNTRSYASVRLSEMMFAYDDDFSTLEQMKETVTRIESKDLYSFLSYVIATAPIDVFYIGSLPEKRVSDAIKKRIIKKETTKDFAPILPYPARLCEYRSLTEKMPVSQGKLAIGFKTGITISDNSIDNAAILLFNELFGGSAASKLFTNVRESLSLCYYCSSSCNQYHGTVTVSAGIENKNREVAEKAILAQLDDIQNGIISDAEFHAAKKSIQNSYRQMLDNPYDLQSFYTNRSIFGINDTLDTAISLIDRIGKDDISRIARQIKCDSVFFVEGTNAQKETDDYDE